MKTPKSLYSRLALATSVTLVVGYFVVYAVYTTIDPARYEGGATLTSTLMTDIITNITDLNTRAWNLNGTSSYYTAGNVGIGTASPGSLLYLYGTNTTGGITQVIHNVGNDGIDTTPYVNIQAKLSAIRNGGEIRFGRESTYGSITTADSYLGLYTAIDDVNIERLRVTSVGNVGIGTTTPQTKLDVNGPVKILRADTAPFVCDTTKWGSMYIDSDPGGNDELCICNYRASTSFWRTPSYTACD